LVSDRLEEPLKPQQPKPGDSINTEESFFRIQEPVSVVSVSCQ
jgi:hypothetical protein